MAEPQNRQKRGKIPNAEKGQWKPGKSGNPGGRPKTAKFAEEVREFLAEKQGDKSRLRRVLEDLQKHRPEILLHYAFGKPVDSVEVRSENVNFIDPAIIELARLEWTEKNKCG